jgi:O-acetyl-ADP-ribose deacetylase (regulator of RNase III)
MKYALALRTASCALLALLGTLLAADELTEKLGQFSQSCTALRHKLTLPERRILDYGKGEPIEWPWEMLSKTFAFTNNDGKPVNIIIKMGDMLSQPVDAIVDAANTRLDPGIGVSGSVKVAYCRYRRATDNPTYSLSQPDQHDWTRLCVFPDGTKVTVDTTTFYATDLQEGGACLNLGVRCLPNDGDTTKSVALIHAVAPRNPKRMNLVYSAYKNALDAAENVETILQKYKKNPALEQTFKTKTTLTKIAFPVLGVGVFGLPVQQVLEQAFTAMIDFLKTAKNVDTVYLMVFVDPTPKIDPKTKKEYPDWKEKSHEKSVDNFQKTCRQLSTILSTHNLKNLQIS